MHRCEIGKEKIFGSVDRSFGCGILVKKVRKFGTRTPPLPFPSLKCHTSPPPNPGGAGERERSSLSPAPPRVRGWPSHDILDYLFPDPILKVRLTQSTRSVCKRKNRAQLLIVGKKNLAIKQRQNSQSSSLHNNLLAWC